jgi:F-type H+-transporting ATPase subunit epsilon
MISIRIITPDGETYADNEILSATLPTTEGVITVLDDHVPMICLLKSGEMLIQKDNNSVELAVSTGIIQITRIKENEEEYTLINVLADTAERAEDIDIERAMEARKRAEDFLAQKENEMDVDFALIQSQIEKELARINLGSKYKKLNRTVIKDN